MRPLLPRLYASPIDLPESKSGKVSITHSTIDKSVDLLTMREAVLTGRPPKRVKLAGPLRIHTLSEEGVGCWMTDHPIELRQSAEWIRSAGLLRSKKRVLVGGLGLGIVATWLTDLGCDVTVVELSADVIRLVSPQSRRGGWKTVRGDIAEFIESVDSWPYDYTFLDTWQSTSEECWWSTVLPLRRRIVNRFGPKRIHCWAEDMMRGQVASSLSMSNPSVQKQLTGKSVRRGWYYAGLGSRELSPQRIETLFRRIGTPSWEREWGDIVEAGYESVEQLRRKVV